jgi:hypothetical protein
MEKRSHETTDPLQMNWISTWQDFRHPCSVSIMAEHPQSGDRDATPQDHEYDNPTVLDALQTGRDTFQQLFKANVDTFDKVSIVKTSAHANSCGYPFLKRLRVMGTCRD